MRIGLLHPGAMGVTIGAAARDAGHEVLWLPENRSAETRQRAEGAGLTDVDSLAELAKADIVISVCPPHGALALAEQVMNAGFTGIYVDGNAVAPATAQAIAAIAGRRFVDGGIIGPPATRPGATRLYLSGVDAGAVAEIFTDTVLDARVVAGGPGAASALKMCYAAYTKGLSALLLNIRALAMAEGVEEALLGEWQISQRDLAKRSEGSARGTAGKAWRFVGEMQEIAATFRANNLPDGFHQGAAEVYERMSDLKHAREPILSDVLDALLKAPG